MTKILAYIRTDYQIVVFRTLIKKEDYKPKRHKKPNEMANHFVYVFPKNYLFFVISLLYGNFVRKIFFFGKILIVKKINIGSVFIVYLEKDYWTIKKV